MITRNTNIRHWRIAFNFSFNQHDLGVLTDALIWADAPESIINTVTENVRAGRRNEGFCFSNPSLRRSVIGVGVTDTGPEFLDTTVHEIVHVAQHISENDGIDPLSEDFAYLAGDISHEISDIVCEMSCPYCREH